jgi:hypothetical protein
MKTPKPDPLFHEIFAGDELRALRHASLEGGLAALRFRRRLRLAFRATGAAAVLLLAFSLVWRPAFPTASIPSPALVATQPASAAPHIKMLTDDELLALFPNQQVALIGSPGHQQLMVFDENGVEHPL